MTTFTLYIENIWVTHLLELGFYDVVGKAAYVIAFHNHVSELAKSAFIEEI